MHGCRSLDKDLNSVKGRDLYVCGSDDKGNVDLPSQVFLRMNERLDHVTHDVHVGNCLVLDIVCPQDRT